MSGSVEIDLPPAWLPLELAADGARAAQRQLLDGWFAGAELSPAAREAAVTRLAQESRRAFRAGTGFAAILLLALDDLGTPTPSLVLGSLTVGFRSLPGATDPRVAAEGTLQVLRDVHGKGYATRRVELVGLGRDPDRPAVLLREQRLENAVPLAHTQVLWLVPGTSQLGQVAITTPNRDLAGSFTELVLSVASTLRVNQAVPA